LQEWINAGATWSTDVIGSAALGDERLEPHHEFQPAGNTRDPGPILLRRLTVAEYIETVRRAVGVNVEQEARQILPPDLRADGFSNTAYNLNVDLGHVEAYARLARLIAERLDVVQFAARYTNRQELTDANMRRLIAGMGKWLLRGPLQEQEIAAFLRVPTAVAKEGGNFKEAASYLVEAMLQSPRFLYRLENYRGGSAATSWPRA
jgi:hypothetical protein